MSTQKIFDWGKYIKGGGATARLGRCTAQDVLVHAAGPISAIAVKAT